MSYLPSELLLAIFGEVESDNDLLSLAATSRRFNHLSLQVFFINHNFDPNSKTIKLTGAHCETLKKISALAMSLALRGTSLDHLTFDFGCIHDSGLLLYKIRILTRYIMNLSTIDRVTLHIFTPAFPIVTRWKRACLTFLETVIRKSCSNLHVETTRCLVVRQPDDEDILSLYHVPPPTSKKPRWFGILWGRHSKVHVISNPKTGTKHLKECFIQSFPPFLRPFYFRVLKANASVLTDLSFKRISSPLGAIDLGFLITNLHLPVLKRFAISFGVIPRHAIVEFLSKHSHITSFEYHHIDYSYDPRSTLYRLDDGLYHLKELTTTPDHIITLLPPLDLMPSLTSITLEDEESYMDCPFSGAIRSLSSYSKKIKLTIVIPFTDLTVTASLVRFIRPSSSLSGFLLHCVESLCLRQNDWGLSETILDQLLVLLGLFPELKQLILHSFNPSSQKRPSVIERNTSLYPFFEQAKLVCPSITSISIRGDSEWTYTYPSWCVQVIRTLLHMAGPLICDNQKKACRYIFTGNAMTYIAQIGLV